MALSFSLPKTGSPMTPLDAQIRHRLMALDDDEPPKSRSVQLTDEIVSGFQFGARESVVHDSTVSRLFLRVRPTGSKAFYFACSRAGEGRTRKVFIGSARDLSVDQARWLALDRWEEERTNGVPRNRMRLSRNVSVEQAFEAYGNRRIPERSVNHARHTGRVLGPFVDAYRDHQISQLRRGMLISWVAQAGAVAPSRSRAVHKALRAFLSWCVDAGALEYNPLAGTSATPPVSNWHRVLNGRELSKIYVASTELDGPWRVLVGFLMLTGATVQTARNLHRSQVNVQRGLWSWQKCVPWELPQQWMPLSAECCGLLSQIPSPEDYYFQSPRKRRPDPTHLHNGVLRELQRLSELSDWSWRDLVRSIRGALKPCVLKLPVTNECQARDEVDRWARVLAGVPTKVLFEDEDVVL